MAPNLRRSLPKRKSDVNGILGKAAGSDNV